MQEGLNISQEIISITEVTFIIIIIITPAVLTYGKYLKRDVWENK